MGYDNYNQDKLYVGCISPRGGIKKQDLFENQEYQEINKIYSQNLAKSCKKNTAKKKTETKGSEQGKK